MSYNIVESSPQAKSKIASYEDNVGVSYNNHHRAKYPFEELKIGNSFTIPVGEASDGVLRTLATNKGKKLGKKFSVIKHTDLALIEVARIA